MKYKVNRTINTGDKRIEPGETIEPDETEAAPLLAIGAITLIEEPVEEEGEGGESEAPKEPKAKKATAKKTPPK